MKRLAGVMLLLLTGCMSWLVSDLKHISPPDEPPLKVEEWWNDFLGSSEPSFAALLLEASDKLRSDGKEAVYTFSSGAVVLGASRYCCTWLPLPIPEACASKLRDRLAALPAESLVPTAGNVISATAHGGEEHREYAAKVWHEAAQKLGYRGRTDRVVPP